MLRRVVDGLAQDWDPVLHPRYWRVVSNLPENRQGKVTMDDLQGLFRDVESEAGLDDRPETLQEIRKGDILEHYCRVSSDLACLAGHFPDFPVVPGVLQVDWAMSLAADLLGAAPRVEEIESIKFRAPLRPGDHFRIRVRSAPGDRIEFKVWSDDAEYARGRLRVAAEARER